MIPVVVPWRETPSRQPVWDRLRLRWQAYGYEAIEGSCPDGPWRKALAVADGMSKADAGVVVVADADVWCEGIADAVAAVADHGVSWAIPHHLVVRLGPDDRPVERPYPGRAGGGLVVLARATYEQVPMDPRFAGWGQEDEAWGIALRCLLGKPWRGTADLYHYWHEPQPRKSRAVGSDEGQALLRRYSAAARDQATTRQLLDEARGFDG